MTNEEYVFVLQNLEFSQRFYKTSRWLVSTCEPGGAAEES